MNRLQERFFNLPVEQAMTPKPICVSPQTKVNEILDILNERKIHAVLVVDEEQRILMLFVYDINEGVNDITKNDLITAVVQKLCNKPSSDLACAKVYCFFHILFSFLERT